MITEGQLDTEIATSIRTANNWESARISKRALPGRTAAGASSGYHVCQSLIEIDATIAHVTDLLGLGQGVDDVTRLCCRPGLNDQRGRARSHGSAERSAPGRRITATRECGNHSFSRSSKQGDAGAVVGESAANVKVGS